MTDFFSKSAPLGLALLFGFIAVAGAIISQGSRFKEASNYNERKARAITIVFSNLPHSLCLSAFSYDIWVITTLFSADPKTLQFYNLTNKATVIPLLLLFHVMFFIFVLGWSGAVREQPTGSDVKYFALENICAVISILLCIGFQVF